MVHALFRVIQYFSLITNLSLKNQTKLSKMLQKCEQRLTHPLHRIVLQEKQQSNYKANPINNQETNPTLRDYSTMASLI